MTENAHNIEQPFKASMSLETNEDISLINAALSRLHLGCQKHSNELIEARNLSTRFKNECAELKKELEEITNKNNAVLNELKARLAVAEEKMQTLTTRLEEKSKELGQQAKNNHDMNLLLMEKDNQHSAFKKQAERKIAELNEASKTVEKMRKMLGDFQSQPEKIDLNYTLTTEPDESMTNSFEQWLKPAENKKFKLIDD
jgi:chromosome segregation ATPase